MKKEVGKRKMAFTRDTIRELSSPASVSGGARTIEPVSTKPCSDPPSCFKMTTQCH